MSSSHPASNFCGNNCCVCVQQDEVGVYEFCGKYKGNLKPGCNTLGLDCCGVCMTTKVISNRITENVVTCETKTKDNVFVRVSCAVQQQPKADRVNDCVYRLRNPRQQIESYVGDVVRAQVPNMNLEEVFVNKDAIADAVGQKITYSMADFGWRILQSLVVNVDPDKSVKDSMNRLVAAEKQREAAEITAEASKLVFVKNAEAQAQTKALQGQGISMQRAAIINGLKDSVGTESRELSPQMVSELLLITQYYDTLESICNAKGKTVFLPNGIATVNDTAKQIRMGVLGKGGTAPPPTSIPRTTPWHPRSTSPASDDSAGGFDDFGFGAEPPKAKPKSKKANKAPTSANKKKPKSANAANAGNDQVTCPHCHQTIMKAFLQKHNQHCPKAPKNKGQQPPQQAQPGQPEIITCQKCGQKVMAKFYQQHMQHCQGNGGNLDF